MQFPYVEKCVESIEALDWVQLAEAGLPERRVGETNGLVGSTFNTYSLPSVQLEGVPLAVKVPQSGGDPYDRLRGELRDISLILDRVPEAWPKMPYFMGLVAVDTKPIAIVTEDATNGGERSIWQALISEPGERFLAERFADMRPLEEVFERKVLDHGMCFDVGDEARWLDFTPSPFKAVGRLPDFEACSDYVGSHLLAVTVDIDNTSPLAQDITAKSYLF